MVFQGAHVQAVKRTTQWTIMEHPRGIYVEGLFLSLVQLHKRGTGSELAGFLSFVIMFYTQGNFNV